MWIEEGWGPCRMGARAKPRFGGRNGVGDSGQRGACCAGTGSQTPSASTIRAHAQKVGGKLRQGGALPELVGEDCGRVVSGTQWWKAECRLEAVSGLGPLPDSSFILVMMKGCLWSWPPPLLCPWAPVFRLGQPPPFQGQQL